MGRIGRIGLIAAVVGLAAVVAWAAGTAVVTAPVPSGARSGRATNRFAEPVEGFATVLVTTDGVTDQTVTTDAEMSGYLERVVYSHNGNDAAWTLTVTDASGVVLHTDTAADATSDPHSYIVSASDSAGNPYGGVPFVGALSIAISDADGGTGTAVSVLLYIREAWRR